MFIKYTQLNNSFTFSDLNQIYFDWKQLMIKKNLFWSDIFTSALNDNHIQVQNTFWYYFNNLLTSLCWFLDDIDV